jgi:type IV secretory pathway VirB2 component (pilin)
LLRLSAATGWVPLTDPTGSRPLVAAVEWLQGTLLGTIATSVAIVAIAAVGLSMLTGRIPLRRGGTVILGCFILFGASSIVAGFQRVAGLGSSVDDQPPVRVTADTSPLIVPPPPSSPARPYDPYAGASVPD